MKLSIDYIMDSIGGNLLAGDKAGWAEGISTDSRTIKPGQVFFALPGDNFDGHDYIDRALQEGAAAAIISQPDKIPDGEYAGSIIVVKDTLEALQRLAGTYRQLFHIPITAITGSVGKTTTKDILADCLSTSYRILKTPGNYNNEIGLPLTLMNIGIDHQAAVVELAMRRPGEIAHLAAIVKPTYAVITNVEPVHLETMGSLENIARAKCEVLEFIAQDKFALINGDNSILMQAAAKYSNQKLTFGYGDKCDFQIKALERAGAGMNISIRFMEEQTEWFWFPLHVRKWAANITAAAGCAYLMGVKAEEIRRGLANYQPDSNRMNIVELAAGGAVIDDTYNANPVSMIAALEVSKDISRQRQTVAVLGDMLELGDYEQEGHRLVGQAVAQLELDWLVTIGARAAYIKHGALQNGMPVERVIHFSDRDASLSWLKENVDQESVVLFKASRGMRLEELMRSWLQ